MEGEEEKKREKFAVEAHFVSLLLTFVMLSQGSLDLDLDLD